MKLGSLVLETGEIFNGFLSGDSCQAGELVFNTSHTGYEEMATDPSYYNQILVMTAPLQGNYGAYSHFWQSDQIWIKGFICLELTNSPGNRPWLETLKTYKIPVLSFVDTRTLTLKLRTKGALWGAIVPQDKTAIPKALSLIKKEKAKPKDWTKKVCIQTAKEFKGKKKRGPKLALIDFGYKKNILNEMLKRSSKVCVFPSTSSSREIKTWSPDALLLSNGPGDPKDVNDGIKLVQKLLGWRAIFGICMGHQVLSHAMGGETYKLKFGHRGSNHPIEDRLLGKIYISAQNHGYAVCADSLPKDIFISHVNLNDKTVAGIFSKERKCLSVQFHPENHPGPIEATELFDFFIHNLVKDKSF